MFPNCCSALTFLILALGSFALLLASNVSMIGKNVANSHMFLLGLNMENLKADALVSSLSSSDTAAELGFSDNYVFGLYGYCRGNFTASTESLDSLFQDSTLQNASCSKSKPGYYVDPLQFVVDEINNNNNLGLSIDESDITLPGNLKTYRSTIKSISYLMYATSIIALIATAFSVVFYFLCFCCGGRLWVILTQAVAFATSVIYAASFSSVYAYIRQEFNSNYSTFGINAFLSYRLLAVVWVGVCLSLLTLLHVVLSGCCCLPSRPQYVQKPYAERIL